MTGKLLSQTGNFAPRTPEIRLTILRLNWQSRSGLVAREPRVPHAKCHWRGIFSVKRVGARFVLGARDSRSSLACHFPPHTSSNGPAARAPRRTTLRILTEVRVCFLGLTISAVSCSDVQAGLVSLPYLGVAILRSGYLYLTCCYWQAP